MDTFYVAGRPEWETVEGEWIKFRNYPMFKFFVRQHCDDCNYIISEYYSGCKVGSGAHREYARRNTLQRLKKESIINIAGGIIKGVADFGLNPNVTPDEFAKYIVEVIVCEAQFPGSAEKDK